MSRNVVQIPTRISAGRAAQSGADRVIERIGSFVHAGQAAQRAVDRAIARADLLAEVRRRRRLVEELRRTHLAELTDAEIRLGFAELELDEFEHEGRAVR